MICSVVKYKPTSPPQGTHIGIKNRTRQCVRERESESERECVCVREIERERERKRKRKRERNIMRDIHIVFKIEKR